MFEQTFLNSGLNLYLITYNDWDRMETTEIMAADLNAAYNNAKSRGLEVYHTQRLKEKTSMTYSFSPAGLKITCEKRV